jgi:hypothetical protein
MIQLAWRQFRTQAFIGACLLAVVGVVLGSTWQHVSGLVDVLPRPVVGGFYGGVSSTLDFLVIFVPGLIGIFWGAPLVSRELETRSILLVWTQSVTRSRWLAIRLCVVGLCALVLAGVLGLLGSLWSAPIGQLSLDRFSPLVFAARGTVPLGYAAFAFTLGIAAGMIIRRTLPAMATALAVFAAVRVVVTYWVRPYLAAPLRATFALNSSDVAVGLYPSEQTVKAFVGMPDALIRSTQIVDGAGHPLTPQAVTAAFPNMGLGQDPALGWFQNGVDKLASAYHVVVTYQPPDRFWAFQAIETAVFFVLAFALVALSFWWVRRRLS